MPYSRNWQKAQKGWISVLMACIMFWKAERTCKISANIILYLSFPSSQLQHSLYSVSATHFQSFKIVLGGLVSLITVQNTILLLYSLILVKPIIADCCQTGLRRSQRLCIGPGRANFRKNVSLWVSSFVIHSKEFVHLKSRESATLRKCNCCVYGKEKNLQVCNSKYFLSTNFTATGSRLFCPNNTFMELGMLLIL